MPPSPPRLPLVVEALTDVTFFYEALARTNQMAVDSDKLRAFTALADCAASHLAVVRGVIAAQTKAAEGLNLKEWTLWGPLPCRGQPQEHFHAANDHAAPPEQPTPTVA